MVPVLTMLTVLDATHAKSIRHNTQKTSKNPKVESAMAREIAHSLQALLEINMNTTYK